MIAARKSVTAAHRQTSDEPVYEMLAARFDRMVHQRQFKHAADLARMCRDLSGDPAWDAVHAELNDME